MDQDQFFLQYEADNYFRRNKSVLSKKRNPDWPCHLIDSLDCKNDIQSVLDLGCANGIFLDQLQGVLGAGPKYCGVDASLEAINDGKERFQSFELQQGLLSDIPFQAPFDLVSILGVFSWIDRRTLATTVREIDRVAKDGGYLLIGDFLPDYQHRRHYHHMPTEGVYTFKQDYAKIFTSLGTYREIAKIGVDHRDHSTTISSSNNSVRFSYTLLKKSLQEYYPVISS